MLQQHPITPPPELVAQIHKDALHGSRSRSDYELRMVHAAYRAGADAELEACLDQLRRWGFHCLENLRNIRRPKPPSLAEQALNAAKDMSDCMKDGMLPNRSSLETICAALERLQQLELENHD